MNSATTAAAHDAAHNDHGHLAHIASPKTLVGIFVALLFLTGITVAVSMYGEYLGNYSLLVALVIALIKATLVGLYFMHLRYDKPFNVVIFLGCIVFVTIFISFSLLDTLAYHPSINNVQPKNIPTSPSSSVPAVAPAHS